MFLKLSLTVIKPTVMLLFVLFSTKLSSTVRLYQLFSSRSLCPKIIISSHQIVQSCCIYFFFNCIIKRFYQLLSSRCMYFKIIICNHQVMQLRCCLFSLQPNHQALSTFTSCLVANFFTLKLLLAIIRLYSCAVVYFLFNQIIKRCLLLLVAQFQVLVL